MTYTVVTEESTGMVAQKEPEPESVKALLRNLLQKLGMYHDAKKKAEGGGGKEYVVTVAAAWKRLSRQTSGTIRVIVVVVTLLFVITVFSMPSPLMTVSLIVTGAPSMTRSERLASLRSRQ